jgi:multidrug efflux pump subunit AcrA (membrane-fusion protein)
MVHVVAQVTDPFKTESSRPPLTPGMFVRVDIEGRQIENIYRLPRYAIRRGTEVWVVGGTGETKELTIQPVNIVRMDRDFAYVAAGLNEGVFVITSALETVTDGMDIRIHVDDKAENQ